MFGRWDCFVEFQEIEAKIGGCCLVIESVDAWRMQFLLVIGCNLKTPGVVALIFVKELRR